MLDYGKLEKALHNLECPLLFSPVDNWLLYANTRIATAHDYSGDKAQQALEVIEAFVPDAIALYQTLTENPWPPTQLPCN